MNIPEIAGSLIFAWFISNLAIFLLLGPTQAEELSRRTIDRFKRAIGTR